MPAIQLTKCIRSFPLHSLCSTPGVARVVSGAHLRLLVDHVAIFEVNAALVASQRQYGTYLLDAGRKCHFFFDKTRQEIEIEHKNTRKSNTRKSNTENPLWWRMLKQMYHLIGFRLSDKI